MSEEKLVDLFKTFYNEDPQVGHIVTLRNRFEHCEITAAVTGLRRYHAHRGYDPAGDYEVVIYQRLKLHLAGIAGWFKIGDWEDDQWTVINVSSSLEDNMLEPEVVMAQHVEEFLSNEEVEDEDEL